MKETLNKSVKLADGLMQMHFTVRMTSNALSAKENQSAKFMGTASPGLAGLKNIGTSDSFSIPSAA